MKKLIVAISLLLSSATYAQEQVEVVTRFSAVSIVGQNIISLVGAMNETQNKYEFRFSSIPGAEGETAYKSGFAKFGAGSKIIFISSVSDFTFGKLTNHAKREWSEDDLTFVSGLFNSYPAVLVRNDSPFNTIEELVAHLRSKPESYISTNVNARGNLYLGQVFKNHYKLDNLTTLRYGPIPDIMASVVRGESDLTIFAINDMPSLKPILIVSDKRSELFPNVPTTVEKGLPAMLVNSFSFITAPKQQTQLIADLRNIMAKLCKNDEFKKIILTRRYEVSNMCIGEEQIRMRINTEFERIKENVK